MQNVSNHCPERLSAAADVAVPGERESRSARRKRETRVRLLEAALGLIAEKGVEGVAINEITEAADVGFGSFYNYFESKDAIYTALTEWVFETFADGLDRLVENLSDPAQIVAVCIRHTLLRARREPVWGRFLLREGFSTMALHRGLGQRLLRDIQKGLDAKRFTPADPALGFISAGGTVMAAIAAELQWSEGGAEEKDGSSILGFHRENLPERTAAAVLCILGLGRPEAEHIAFLFQM